MARNRVESDLPVGREPTGDLWEAIYTQRAIRYWQEIFALFPHEHEFDSGKSVLPGA